MRSIEVVLGVCEGGGGRTRRLRTRGIVTFCRGLRGM